MIILHTNGACYNLREHILQIDGRKSAETLNTGNPDFVKIIFVGYLCNQKKKKLLVNPCCRLSCIVSWSEKELAERVLTAQCCILHARLLRCFIKGKYTLALSLKPDDFLFYMWLVLYTWGSYFQCIWVPSFSSWHHTIRTLSINKQSLVCSRIIGMDSNLLFTEDFLGESLVWHRAESVSIRWMVVAWYYDRIGSVFVL